MSDLDRLQFDFQAYLTGAENHMLERVNATSKADRETLLGVYREAYALRLVETLATNYPKLAVYLGDDAHERMARAYIAAHPSHHPSIRWFGHRLAEFLALTAPWSEQPVIADLAKLEWMLSETFDAADATPLAFETVAAVPPAQWPGLRFRPLPSLRRFELAMNATAIWRALDADETPPVAAPLETPPVQWAAWRPRLTTEYRSLETDEAAALDAVMAGADFASLCERLFDWHAEDEAAARAAGLLRAWIDAGMIAAIDSGEGAGG